MAAAIQCPNCRSPVQAKVQQLVDVGQDPAAKSRLLSGSLNVIQCQTCGYQGQLATPLVYHDPAKELLLTYVPVEVGLPKDEQERIIGRLINRATESLPAEQRKAYLLQPQAVLTMQGLIERVLEADGVTREQLESQRAKIRLFEQLLRTPAEQLEQFVKEHDAELDDSFFQLGALSLQATAEGAARQAATERLETALELSGYGERLAAREQELRAAADSLRQAGERLTREKLLDIVIEAPNQDRIQALASLARPAMDYQFFQLLSERMDAAEEPEKQKLSELRKLLLTATEQLDQAQQAELDRASSLLSTLMQAEQLEQAVDSALPLIDELFLSVLQANLRAAREQGQTEAAARLSEIDSHVRQAIRDSLPPNLRLAQSLLEAEDQAEAERLLEQSVDQIDDQVLGALMSATQRLEQAEDQDGAERMRQLHRKAMRLSMKAKMDS